eukprot:4923593-Amphidinium_carterae.2
MAPHAGRACTNFMIVGYATCEIADSVDAEDLLESNTQFLRRLLVDDNINGGWGAATLASACFATRLRVAAAISRSLAVEARTCVYDQDDVGVFAKPLLE